MSASKTEICDVIIVATEDEKELRVKLDKVDLDKKLNALIKFAVNHCDPEEDKLDIYVSWRLCFSQNNPKKTAVLLWTFKHCLNNLEDITASLSRQEKRTEELKLFLQKNQIKKVCCDHDARFAVIHIE